MHNKYVTKFSAVLPFSLPSLWQMSHKSEILPGLGVGNYFYSGGRIGLFLRDGEPDRLARNYSTLKAVRELPITLFLPD
jgi:hypothetical protein